MKRIRAVLWSVIEYLIGALFVLGGFQTFSAEITGDGPVAAMLGADTALIFYGVIFICSGIYLIGAKIRKSRRHHKYALMNVYLVCLFVVGLEWAIVGAFTADLLDQIVIGAAAAALWLRWKMLTEYINPKDYDEIRQEILDEHNKT